MKGNFLALEMIVNGNDYQIHKTRDDSMNHFGKIPSPPPPPPPPQGPGIGLPMPAIPFGHGKRKKKNNSKKRKRSNSNDVMMNKQRNNLNNKMGINEIGPPAPSSTNIRDISNCFNDTSFDMVELSDEDDYNLEQLEFDELMEILGCRINDDMIESNLIGGPKSTKMLRILKIMKQLHGNGKSFYFPPTLSPLFSLFFAISFSLSF